MKVTQSCPTLCDPMDYTAHGILQVRIQEWVAFPFSRESSQPRDGTQVSCTAGGFFASRAPREAPAEMTFGFSFFLPKRPVTWWIFAWGTTLVSLREIPLGHGVQYSYILLGLLCWFRGGFLCLCSRRMLVRSFFFPVISLSGFGFRLTLASWSEFGRVSSLP